MSDQDTRDSTLPDHPKEVSARIIGEIAELNRQSTEHKHDEIDKSRKSLLVASAISIGINAIGAVPTKIDALGIEFSTLDRKYFLIFMACATAFFLVRFISKVLTYDFHKEGLKRRVVELEEKLPIHLRLTKVPTEKTEEEGDYSLLAPRLEFLVDTAFPIAVAIGAILFSITLAGIYGYRAFNAEFPVAEHSLNLYWMLSLGAAMGFISSVLGVGGFLMVPLLILMGIPPAIAAGTQGPVILSSSTIGLLRQFRRRTLDVKMGCVLIAGGAVGSTLGVLLVGLLRQAGVDSAFIKLSYVVVLAGVGGGMLIEARRGFRPMSKQRPHRHYWVHRLPGRMRFPDSRLYASFLGPLMVGAFSGLSMGALGTSLGMITVPVTIYVIGIPSSVVVGTALLQTWFVSALTAVLQMTLNRTVDLVLAIVLVGGGLVGAQMGSRVLNVLRADYLRLLFAVIVLVISAMLLLHWSRTA
ncbi:MAG: sulfite exporter TauE/SafE family protein [Inquilinus sp.]|uniref:sulfite exporter TauE/SafE family protein n=1 Tax=Inquilinus sp. TaxID=1932117 RepID=UPI003F314E9A